MGAAVVAIWMLFVGCLIGVMNASTYLTDYRHGEFGIGAELQHPGTGRPGGQYHGYPEGTGYPQGGGSQAYDRRHYAHKAWPGPSPSSSSASAAAAAASGRSASSSAAAAAASGSPSAASAAAAAAAAPSNDRRLGYHVRAQKRVYEYPAPRFIPREFDKQPAVQSSYHQPTPRPVYVHPTQVPVYVRPTQPPVYRQWTPAPTYYQPPTQPLIYVRPSQRPTYVQRTHAPVYVQRTQAPVYVQRTQAPVYIQRTQAPIYAQRTQAPVYIQRTQAPAYVQPTPTSETSADCSSSTLCFCCRWTTRYSQTTQSCNQPKQVPAQQQICTAIRDGACVRLGTVSRSSTGQIGTFPAQCTSTRRLRSCTSCCPSRYGIGMPRCTATASVAVQQQHHQQQQHVSSLYSAHSVGAARSAPTVVAAAAAASVGVPGRQGGAQPSSIPVQPYPGTRQQTVYQPGGWQSVSQTHSQRQYSQQTQGRRTSASQSRSSVVMCCLITGRPDCCQSSKQRRGQISGQAIYRTQMKSTDCCSTTRRPECCASTRQQVPRSSIPERSYYSASSAVQPVWQPQQRQRHQQLQQPGDCCSTTRRPECCQSSRSYGQQPQQYQRSQLVAPSATKRSQGDCCSTTRRPECCAASRAALGVPVSRSRTMCCGSSQPKVSCCVTLRLADCCASSRLALCCSVTNNVGKCCSGASTWRK